MMYSGKKGSASDTPSAMNLRFPKRSDLSMFPSEQLKANACPTSMRKRRRSDNDHKEGGAHLLGVSVAMPLQCDDQLVPCGKLEHALEEVDMFPAGSKRRKPPKSCAVLFHQHSQGFFGYLPTEIFHLVLSLLPSDDIASFSLSSSQINSSIRDYIFTMAGSQHILPSTHPLVTGGGHVLSAMPFTDENEYCPKDSDQTSIKDTAKEFENLGILTKQLTMFQPIRSRLKVASFILNRLECTHQTLIMFAGHSSAYFCFGRLLFAFVHGWEDYEKVKAFNLIQTIAKLEQRIKKVLHAEPSSQPLLERDIRLIHRCVFLDHAAKIGEGEYGFWLTQILKQWPITFQARLLYLLTAPENEDGFVSWTLVCGCSNIQHFMMSVNFSELANSLRVLLEFSSKEWSLDHIISIVDELTTTPNGWCLENVSQLLVHCGKDISKGVLGCRAANGRTEELVIICFYMANACLMKDGYEDGSEENIRWFIDILRSTLNILPINSKKVTFIYNLVEKWQDYLTALFEDCTPEHYESETVQTEFLNTLGNFTKLSSVLFQLVVD